MSQRGDRGANGAPWPELNPCEPSEATAGLVTRLCAAASRLEAVLADAHWLIEVCGMEDDGSSGRVPRSAHVVTAAPADAAGPRMWRWTITDRPLVPEFLLFYTETTTFPHSALIFAGAAGRRSWVTFHRRPAVLYRLRERFRELTAGQGPGAGDIEAASGRPAAAPFRPFVAAAASVREERAEPDDVESRGGETRPAAAGPASFVAPSQLYARVLSAHFADPAANRDGDRPTSAPNLAAHQQRACERARDILDRYGGVIIADAVGLGKTYIGLRLLERALETGGRVLVIVPAALRDQWKRELSYLMKTPTDRASHRDCDNLDLWVRERIAGDVLLISHESLGRRDFEPETYRGADLILIDEAHNFRNPSTRRYRNLSMLCRHSQLVLLTATPINNTVLDLQHLIDLFAAPGAFRHLGIPDYRRAFRDAGTRSDDLRAIISACVLRRTRRFLREHYGDVEVRDPRTGGRVRLRLPERRPPIAVEYDLAGTYGDLFDRMEEWLGGLRFPAIAADEVDRAGESIASSGGLLKIILLKRLESSIAALRRTIVQQIAWCDTALRALEAGRVLTRPDYRATFRGGADDPGSQLAFFELMLPAPSADPARIREFRRALESDLRVLADAHSAITAIGPHGDRKAQQLIRLIEGPLAGRKVLVFTEFLDTARHLHRQLWDRPHVAQIDSRSARLGQERASRREVVERFAPRSNGRPEPPEIERVDLLVATDVLSEGLNLQDASVVISYDLPWNPVRLMQRVGRIDRLGALAPHVELYHFLPVRHLERLLRLMERLQRKVSTITATLGLDQPVLAEAGAGVDRIRLLARDADGYTRLEEEVEGPLDPEERAYIDFLTQIERTRTTADGSPAIPTVSPAFSAAIDEAEGIGRAVAYWRVRHGRMRRGLWLVCDLATHRVVEDPAGALEAVRHRSRGPAVEPPPDMLQQVRSACATYARAVLIRLEAGGIAGDALNPSLPQCRIAAWLRRALVAGRYRLTSDSRIRIDRLLGQIARRFSVADERVLAGLASDLPASLETHAFEMIEEFFRTRPATIGPARLDEVGTLLILGRSTGPRTAAPPQRER